MIHTDVSPGLTPRQREVLQAIADGFAAAEIGLRLGIGYETVRTHVQAILQRLDAYDRAHAVALGIRRGLIQ